MRRRSVLALSASIALIWLLWSSVSRRHNAEYLFSQATNTQSHLSGNGGNKKELKKAAQFSPLKMVLPPVGKPISVSRTSPPKEHDEQSTDSAPKLDKLFGNGKITFEKWESFSLKERCSFYFYWTYKLHKGDWSHDIVRKTNLEVELDNEIISLLMERHRVFKDCFIDSEFAVSDIIRDPIKTDTFEFHKSMFPFLSKVDMDSGWQSILPVVVDINDYSQYNVGSESFFKLVANKKHQDFKVDNSKTFWVNWKNLSFGKGIALTAGESHLPFLFKFLNVLDKSGNNYPIQVIHAGELSKEFHEKLAKFLKDTKSKQRVYVIDCKKAIDPEWKESIGNFINKWLAAIFNTFEEAILVDVDVVAFKPFNSFFKDKNYEESGMLMYRDRIPMVEVLRESCRHFFQEMEPSKEEFQQWGHYISNNRTSILSEHTSIESRMFDLFLVQGKMHQIDSGLVVINKKAKIMSLVNSLMMHFAPPTQQCVYGDKEIFWLGQLYSGENFSIFPVPPGNVGELKMEKSEDGKKEKYSVCSAQLAHANEKGELLWINGGLQTCKYPHFAEGDFRDKNEYFTSKGFASTDDLYLQYMRPIHISGILVPSEAEGWTRMDDCNGYAYCTTLEVDTTMGEDASHIKGHLFNSDNHYNGSEPFKGLAVSLDTESLREPNEFVMWWAKKST